MKLITVFFPQNACPADSHILLLIQHVCLISKFSIFYPLNFNLKLLKLYDNKTYFFNYSYVGDLSDE